MHLKIVRPVTEIQGNLRGKLVAIALPLSDCLELVVQVIDILDPSTHLAMGQPGQIFFRLTSRKKLQVEICSLP